MPDITISVVGTRTTTDDCGHQYHTVSGRGITPEDALADLKASARTAAKEVAKGFSLREPERDTYEWRPYHHDNAGRAEWRVEVVGVQLAADPLDSGEPGWAAFGTLASQYGYPSDAGWWDPKPSPTLRDRAARRFGR